MNFPMPQRRLRRTRCRMPASAPAMRHAAVGAGIACRVPRRFADLKPLGQVSASFIVAVNGEGLWIIDQHVAHERVLFEQHLRARREGELGGQRLLVPLIVDLNPRQLATFEQIGEELRANGFEAELMGARSVAIQAAPAGIASARRGKAALRNSRRHRARESGHLDRFAAIENRGFDLVPRGDQSEYAARHHQNGMAARRAGENRISDELPARAAGGAALFGARNRAGVQENLRAVASGEWSVARKGDRSQQNASRAATRLLEAIFS